MGESLTLDPRRLADRRQRERGQERQSAAPRPEGRGGLLCGCSCQPVKDGARTAVAALAANTFTLTISLQLGLRTMTSRPASA